MQKIIHKTFTMNYVMKTLKPQKKNLPNKMEINIDYNT